MNGCRYLLNDLIHGLNTRVSHERHVGRDLLVEALQSFPETISRTFVLCCLLHYEKCLFICFIARTQLQIYRRLLVLLQKCSY